MLEQVVALATWTAMEVPPPVGPLATRHLSFGQMTETLRGLGNAKFQPPIAERIGRWVTAVDDMANRRNELVHSPWIAVPDQPEVPIDDLAFAKVNLRKAQNRLYTVTLRELRDRRDEVDELIGEGIEIEQEIYELFSSDLVRHFRGT